ncbi:unnamed protein product [Rotaria magnacalcarata]|uniref:HTH CENPB-type domain-containing protein n=1 Tax=Rotaria magnacalcarata TaxID=392030 RepID=A0A816X704_9BILA|nr:unnamed protein product [Rotaria magnacalcarata]
MLSKYSQGSRYKRDRTNIKIYDEEIAKARFSPETLASVPMVHDIQPGLNQARRKLTPVLPASTIFDIPVSYQRTATGFPCVFGLLPDRKKSTYQQLFQELKDVAVSMNRIWKSDRIISDFETSLIPAIFAEFPQTLHKGCYFHHIQSIYRRIQNLGLATVYSEDEEIRTCCRKLMALAFLPLDEVESSFYNLRGINIPISGPVLQQYARDIAQQLDECTNFRASNGWLDRFRTRYNIQFRPICGEARAVDPSTVDDWKGRLHSIIEHYDPCNIFNMDETSLFYKLMPDRSLVIDRNDCRGGKRSKDRYTVMLCSNMLGSEKLKPVVIGKYAKPRCFKNIDMKKLPVQWFSNRTAWMNSKIFTEWLQDLDVSMRKQRRHVLMFLDNAPVHPQDIQLENIKLKFFPPNTTAVIQPMDQGIIRAFKAHYRRYLVKHTIANATVAMTADDINVTALDAVYWIDAAWSAVTEVSIRNTFRSAGFEKLPIIDGVDGFPVNLSANGDISMDNKPIEELDRVLKHLTIGGKSVSAYDYVIIDDQMPSFNEWDDSTDRVLSINGFANEDAENLEELPSEDPPSLAESLELVRRLRLLSTTQQPELHPFITELQSKLTDVFLDSNSSKQISILEYFKYTPDPHT